MALTVKDIIASSYVLMDNASEEDLDYAIVVEQLGSVISQMKYERILGNRDDVITKAELTFDDTTGIITNTFTNFGTPVYIEFNSQPIDEAPASQLDIYADAGIQRAAFWADGTVKGTKYIQLALAQTGTIKVWYEPDTSTLLTRTSTVDLQDSLRWCLATRLAAVCAAYLKFKDQIKMASLPVLVLNLQNQAETWRKIYLEKVNRIGTDRPYARLPFIAGVVGN